MIDLPVVTKDNDWVFTFGKYKGETLEDISDKDPQYIGWCIAEVEGFILTDKALSRFCSDIYHGSDDYDLFDITGKPY